MLKLLAFDTSTDACTAALLIGENIFSAFELAERQHAQLILPMIADLLKQVGIKLKELTAIAFGCGPGSFTGIRIATSVVQALAFAHRLPVIPISTLRAVAQTAHQSKGLKKVLVAMDAHMQEIYCGVYQLSDDTLMHAVGTEQLVKPEVLAEILAQRNQQHNKQDSFSVMQPDVMNLGLIDSFECVGDAWQAYSNELQLNSNKSLTRICPVLYPRADAIAHLAKAEFLQNRFVDASRAQPIYLRQSNAWKKMDQQ